MAATSYFKNTRSLAFSLIAIFPALLLYELLTATPAAEKYTVQNAAEFFIKYLLNMIGLDSPLKQVTLYFVCTLLVLIFSYRYTEVKLAGFTAFGLLLFESLGYAIILAAATKYITAWLISLASAAQPAVDGLRSQLLLALAAGVYEEVLFRLFIVGTLLLLLNHLWPKMRRLSGFLAAGIGAAVFSLFHYPSLEIATWESFVFRLVAGWILGILFLTRGLAVAVYTHAFYDILFLLKAI